MELEQRIPEMARNGFAGLTRKELFAVNKILGTDARPSHKDEDLRRLAQQAVGSVSEKVDAHTVVKRKSVIPNLYPGGRWEGRYRRVQLVKTQEFEKQVAFPIGWEDNLKYYHFDTALDMMYPHYEVLKNMKRGTIVEKSKLNEEGDKVTVREEIVTQAVPFQDFGDTPGTEHLPRHMHDYLLSRFEKEGGWKKAPRNELAKFLGLMHGRERVPSLIKDKTDAEVRDLCLTWLGVEDEVEEAA